MAEQLMLRPPIEIKEKLRQIARVRGVTMNALIISILWDWLKQNDKLN